MRPNTTISAYFDPDKSQHIMAADASTVSVRVNWDEYLKRDLNCTPVTSGDGCLRLSRKLYFVAMTQWMDHKTYFCEYGGYGGDGFIVFDDLKHGYYCLDTTRRTKFRVDMQKTYPEESPYVTDEEMGTIYAARRAAAAAARLSP
jgi:hypothetical protein